MTVRTATELKALFETGDRPTQQDFVDLIDSLLHTLGDNFPNPLPAVSAANLINLPIPDPLPAVSGEFLTNINRSDWVAIDALPTYADSTSFVVTGDYTGGGYFAVGRRIRIHLNPTGYLFTTVVSATYAAGPDTTTVEVLDTIPTSALALVDVNLIVDSNIVITSLDPGLGATLAVYRKNAAGSNVEPWTIPAGVASEPGLVELATDAETQALADATRGVTPAGLAAVAVVAATANRLMLRDAAGRAQVATPSAAADIATKSYVDALLPTGTRLVFAQASAPAGWTQDAAANDRVLRLVSGAGGGLGGGWAISGLSADGVALSEAQLPAHVHFVAAAVGSNDFPLTSVDRMAREAGGGNEGYRLTRTSDPATVGLSSPTGSGQAHGHAVSSDGTWRPAYVDVIVAVKD